MLAHQMDVLTPQQYKRIKNNIIDEGGGSSASKVGSLSNNGKGIDWQSQIFRKSLVQNHNLAISGGNSKTTYRVSLNYLDQNGIIKTSAFHRYGGHLNLSSEVSEKFKIGLNLSATYAKNNYAAVGYGVNENAGALYAAINWDPTQPIRDGDGNYYVDPVLTVDNPLAILNGSNSYKNTYRYFGTIHGTYDFLPSLSVKFKLGANATNQRRDTYINRLTKIGRATGGEANVLHGTLSNYLIQGTAEYKKTFDQNDLKVLLGITRQIFLTDRSSMIAKGFSSDATSTNNMGLGDQSTYGIGSSKFGHKLQSYFGRINYAFRNKYLLKASLRIDGSSKFGPNNKYGYFPSFAVGWKLKQEHFLDDVDFLSKLKLRASWGETGNDKIANFLYTTTFSGGAHAIWGDEPVVGISSDRLANQGVRWESTNQLDVGLNFGFVNNRLSGSVDYYHKRTYDMLLNLPIPHSSGYTTQIRNIGSIRNHGIELSLRSQNIRNKNFQWSTNIKFTTLSNKVTDLGGKSEIISGSAGFNNQFFITKIGPAAKLLRL
jgi:TonB-linked SusC/RagA family outer membrane protein